MSLLFLALHEKPFAFRAGRWFSAREIAGEAAAVGKALSGGSGPVFLYCEDGVNFLTGLLGGLLAGRELVLPGHGAPGYLAEIGAGAANLVTDLEGANAVLRLPLAPLEPAGPIIIPAGRLSFFTSGSSGAPRLCAKDLAQLTGELAVLRGVWTDPSGPVVGMVSHQHIYGLLFRILWPLACGAPFVGARHELWESAALHLAPGSFLIASPTHLARIPPLLDLVEAPARIFSSGGLLDGKAARDAAARLGSLPLEVLGSTETGGVAWRRQAQDDEPWQPFPGVDISTGEEGVLGVRSALTGTADPVMMGDFVRVAHDGRFTLHGRADRIVKIEGKRVSLPRVEEALGALDEVADAAVTDLPARRGALAAAVVLTPQGHTRLAALGAFRYSRALRTALASRLEPMERPRLWRFVPQLPQNAQGKRVQAEVRALFVKSAPEMPLVRSRHVGPDAARFELELIPALRWFEGHFPGAPILPGVAQIHIVSLLAQQAWGLVLTGREMARIKFRAVMRPGDVVVLTLRRQGAARVDFSYSRGGEPVASGTCKAVA